MLPTIGITAGDPAGIGLEVVLKSISTTLPLARWFLFADRFVFERNRSQFAPGLNHKWFGVPSEVTDEAVLFLHDLSYESSIVDVEQMSRKSKQHALAY